MKKLTTITILALATSLGGCAGSAYSNRGLDSVHQPVVRNAIYTFDVATTGGELPPSEQGRLQGWFDAMGIRYGDRIAVEDSAVYGTGEALETIRAMVERRGLLLSDQVPVTAGMVPAGYMRITIMRASAQVPECPDWSSRFSIDINNATSSNYGCATNSNLASMVADPNDLIKGASDKPNDPSAATKPIQTFREKKPTGAGDLNGQSTSSGASGGGQ